MRMLDVCDGDPAGIPAFPAPPSPNNDARNLGISFDSFVTLRKFHIEYSRPIDTTIKKSHVMKKLNVSRWNFLLESIKPDSGYSANDPWILAWVKSLNVAVFMTVLAENFMHYKMQMKHRIDNVVLRMNEGI